MWNYTVKSIIYNTVQYKITKSNGNPLTFSEVIDLWKADQLFKDFYAQMIAQGPYDSFFWELPSINKSKLDDAFEFVLVKSEWLSRAASDPVTFKSHFKKEASVVAFSNLGKDAVLVVPTPQSAAENYSHLGQFLRKGNVHQIDRFWTMLSYAIESMLEKERPIWVSTSGLGVAWVHVRIDHQPKYFQYKPYKLEH